MSRTNFTLSIGAAGLAATDHGERVELRHLLAQVSQTLGDGVSTSGAIRDRNNRVVGNWTFGSGAVDASGASDREAA